MGAKMRVPKRKQLKYALLFILVTLLILKYKDSVFVNFRLFKRQSTPSRTTDSRAVTIVYFPELHNNTTKTVTGHVPVGVDHSPDKTALQIDELYRRPGYTEPLTPFCSIKSEENRKIIISESPSNMSDWSFTTKRKCPSFSLLEGRSAKQHRIKYTLSCSSNGRAQLTPSITNSSADIYVTNLRSSCLSKFVTTCCAHGNDVPNVVHYVWYKNKSMKFDFFANMLSVIRYIRPCIVLFHGEFLPYGKYWDYIVSVFSNIIHVKRYKPQTIFGKKVRYHEHYGDIMRMDALMTLGGIYLDADYIVIKDLEPFKKNEVTLCAQPGVMPNCFIMAKKTSTFMLMWYNKYKVEYRQNSYEYNSMFYTRRLARMYPQLVHVENGTLCAWMPYSVYRNASSGKVYKWAHIYGHHLYTRTMRSKPLDELLIRNMNTTLGSLLRHAVYGNKELCEDLVY